MAERKKPHDMIVILETLHRGACAHYTGRHCSSDTVWNVKKFCLRAGDIE